MKRITAVVLAVAILGVGWFLGSPLFIDQEVNEEFGLLDVDGNLDMDSVMAMTPDSREAVRDQIMSLSANAPARSAAESMPSGAPQLLRQGSFIDADPVHKGAGTASVYALADGSHVVRFEDFRTTNGPALVVYLAEHPAPARAADVTNSGFISLGKLKGNVGNQNYVVPASANIENYRSVVVWCELFGVLSRRRHCPTSDATTC
jgi:hypothetical protein